MCKPLSYLVAAPHKLFGVCLSSALCLAALLVGATAIFSDLAFGLSWITGALLGGCLVILGSAWIVGKLGQRPTPLTTVEPVAVQPFSFTAYGPALKSKSHRSPAETMPLVKKEKSQRYETC